MKEANLVPFDHPLGNCQNKVSQIECLEEIERLWISFGRQPTTTDIKNGASRYSLHVFERRFGTWRKALEFFVSYMKGEQEVEMLDDEIKIPDDIQQCVENSENIRYTHYRGI